MRLRVRTLVLLLLLGSLSGCGTITNLGMPLPPCGRQYPTYVYGGVWLDALAVAEYPAALMVPWMYVELVLTLVGDTVTLPITIPVALSGGGSGRNPSGDPRTQR